MALVNIAQLLDKDIFVSKSIKSINVRRNTSTNSDILGTVKGGERIGRVYTWANGTDAKGKKIENEIWLQLYEKYSNPSGFGAWIKLTPYVLDSRLLREEGVKTVAEIEKEKKEKEKEENETWYEKIFDKLGAGVKKALPWVVLVYVGGKLVEGGMEGRAQGRAIRKSKSKKAQA